MARKPPPSKLSRHKSGVQRKAAEADVVHRLTHPKPRTQRGKILTLKASDQKQVNARLNKAGVNLATSTARGAIAEGGAEAAQSIIGSRPSRSKPTTKKKVVLRKKVASSRVRQSQRERGKLKLKQRRAEGRAR
jgi:hypothetical protein